MRWMKLSLRSPSLYTANIRYYKYTRLTTENGMLEDGKITVLTTRFQTQPKFIRSLKCYPQWENTAGVSRISRRMFEMISTSKVPCKADLYMKQWSQWSRNEKSNFWLSKVRKLTPFISEPTVSSVSTNIPGSPVSAKQHWLRVKAASLFFLFKESFLSSREGQW